MFAIISLSDLRFCACALDIHSDYILLLSGPSFLGWVLRWSTSFTRACIMPTNEKKKLIFYYLDSINSHSPLDVLLIAFLLFTYVMWRILEVKKITARLSPTLLTHCVTLLPNVFDTCNAANYHMACWLTCLGDNYTQVSVFQVQ